MTFDEYVDREFYKNLELAIEEIAMHDNSDDIMTRAWNVATEWTKDDVEMRVTKYLSHLWWRKQEGINKAFYE